MPAAHAARLLSLTELVEPSRWQRIQDSLSRVLNLPIRTVGLSRELLVPPSWPSNLMNEHIMSLLNAGEELEQLIPTEHPPQDAASVTTVLGATYTAAPIRAASDLIVAYGVIGPVVVGVREDETDFRRRVHVLGLDAAALWPVMLSLKLYSFSSLRSLLSLVEDMGALIAETALSARFPQPPTSTASGFTPRLSQTLLEAAVAATRADGGSVMQLSASGEMFEIKAGIGLPEAVTQAGVVKRRESLAEVAVEGALPLIVDETTAEPRLRNRMHQRQTVSSLIFPLAAGPGGTSAVLSLRSTTAGRCFGREDVEAVSRLLKLIGDSH